MIDEIAKLQGQLDRATAADDQPYIDYYQGEINRLSFSPDKYGQSEESRLPIEQQSRGVIGDIKGGLTRGAIAAPFFPADVATMIPNAGIFAYNQLADGEAPYYSLPSTKVLDTVSQDDPDALGLGLGHGSRTGWGMGAEILGGGVVPGAVLGRSAANAGMAGGKALAREGMALGGASIGGGAASGAFPDSPWAGLLGSVFGGLMPAGMSKVAAGSRNDRVETPNFLSEPQRRANQAAFDRLGIDAPEGAIVGPGTGEKRAIEGEGAEMAFAKGRQVADQMEARVGDFAENMAGGRPLSVTEAGGSLQQDIMRRYDDFTAEGGRRFDVLEDAIKQSGVTTDMPTLRMTLLDMTDSGAFSGVISNKTASRLLKSFPDDGMPVNYKDLKQLRTWIGDQMKNASLGRPVDGKLNEGQLRRLYGAMSDDLGDAAESAGVRDLFDDANNYWSKGKDLFKQLSPMVKANVTPEQAYQKIAAGMRGGETMPNRVFGQTGEIPSMSPDARGHVLGQMIDELGIPIASVGTPDTTFSNNSFLTNLNKMNRRGGLKAATSGMPDASQRLDDLEIATGRIREAERFGYNPSGSGAVVNRGQPSIIGGIAGAGVGGGLGAIGGPLGGAVGSAVGAGVGAAAGRRGRRFMQERRLNQAFDPAQIDRKVNWQHKEGIDQAMAADIVRFISGLGREERTDRSE